MIVKSIQYTLGISYRYMDGACIGDDDIRAGFARGMSAGHIAVRNKPAECGKARLAYCLDRKFVAGGKIEKIS